METKIILQKKKPEYVDCHGWLRYIDEGVPILHAVVVDLNGLSVVYEGQLTTSIERDFY